MIMFFLSLCLFVCLFVSVFYICKTIEKTHEKIDNLPYDDQNYDDFGNYDNQ